MKETVEKMRIIIVDDEPPARKGLRKMLEKDPEIEIVGEGEDGPSALQLINSKDPDIVFLDIQMPGMNGIELLRSLPEDEMPSIVFVTAYDRYALQAFEVHATDYLLKPINENRLKETLKRIKRRLARPSRGSETERLIALMEQFAEDHRPGKTKDGPVERIPVRLGRKVVFVKTRDIDWIEAVKDYARLHVGGTEYLIRKTMSSLESSLDSQQFVRIHRSTIVNVERVRELLPLFAGDYTLVLTDGTKLTLTRKHRDKMKRVLHSFSWLE